MVTFTRRHYVLIGEMLRELPQKEKEKWFNKWDEVFRNDNPRYQGDKFHEFVMLWRRDTHGLSSEED